MESKVAKRFRKTKKKIFCASLDGELAVNQKVKEANNVSSNLANAWKPPWATGDLQGMVR